MQMTNMVSSHGVITADILKQVITGKPHSAVCPSWCGHGLLFAALNAVCREASTVVE